MTLPPRLKQWTGRAQRLWRHVQSVVRYPTPYRLYNLGLAEMERLTKRVQVKGKPYILIIDPLNTCQLKCPFCPTGIGDLPLKGGKMRLEQFTGLIDSIAPHTFKVVLYNWGEPFLHRDIVPMLQHCHQHRIATAISSNLNALPEGGGEAVVRSGLDELIVSCDGLTQETYVQYRKGGELAKVSAHLKEIAEAKRRLKSKTPHIEFQFLVFAHNEHEIPQVHAFAREHGAGTIRILAPFVDLEQDEIRPAQNPEYVKAIYQEPDYEPAANMFMPDPDQAAAVAAHPPPLECFWPWRSLVVNWNGQVDPCCFANYLTAFGNIFEDPLTDIWNGPAYLSARRWIAGIPEPADLEKIVCRGCPGYH